MAEAPSASASASAIRLSVKWRTEEVVIEMEKEETVGDLKEKLCGMWGVLPCRQKLMGLMVGAKLASDETRFEAIKLKANPKVSMMGSLEEEIKEALQEPEDTDGIVNDFDVKPGTVDVHLAAENLAKIQKRIDSYEIKVQNAPRPGKKLLVLDIDYTLYDHRSNAEHFGELTRPYLHEFLTAAYEHYDIVIWSATSMKWIEVKMREIGVEGNPNYKIAFYLDSRAMITVHSEAYGVVEVKPLGVIWGKFPEVYRPQNTIMFDDLRRNFLMNPRNGLRIHACRNLPLTRNEDKELLYLTEYLLRLAALDDDAFAKVDHRKWREYGQ